jgi:hypothetical protein
MPIGGLAVEEPDHRHRLRARRERPRCRSAAEQRELWSIVGPPVGQEPDLSCGSAGAQHDLGDVDRHFDETIILAAQRDDPEAAQAEWESEFRGDLSTYIDRTVLELCVDRAVSERPFLRQLPVHESATNYSIFSKRYRPGGTVNHAR